MEEDKSKKDLLTDFEQLFESLRPGETEDGSYVEAQFGALVTVCSQRGYTLKKDTKRETPTKEQLFYMYKDARAVQDACNLSGVVFSFARHMQTLCDMGLDTERKNNHPVSVLFASKIASLTSSNSDAKFGRACRETDKRMKMYMEENDLL